MKKKDESNWRKAERKPVRTDVEFYVADEIIKAVSINVSEGGIRFDTAEPIKICLRMELEGELINREAQIVWAKKMLDEGVTYGFEYTSKTNCW